MMRNKLRFIKCSGLQSTSTVLQITNAPGAAAPSMLDNPWHEEPLPPRRDKPALQEVHQHPHAPEERKWHRQGFGQFRM